MVYGRKRKTRILFSYFYGGGAGETMVIFSDYRGMSNKDLVEVREWLEEKLSKDVVITNWKVLNER